MSTLSLQQSPVTEDHLRVFGTIVHAFAMCDALMVSAMAALSAAGGTPMSVICSGLSHRGKRDALLGLLRAKRSLHPNQRERVARFLGEFHKWSDLRSSVVHASWGVGHRPDSIMPMALSLRRGAFHPKGFENDVPDYTMEELTAAAGELQHLVAHFQEYLTHENLMPTRA
jgi:hypothetical protein